MQHYAALLIFFLLTIYILYPSYITKNNNNNNNFLKNKLLYDYLKTISPYMYSVKLDITNVPKMEFNNFYLMYLLFLKRMTKNEKSVLKSRFEKADKLIKLSTIKCLLNIPWKIWVSKNNLELSMPFTVDEYIVIPETKINTVSASTLIHEKIHILQRKNQEKFNNFYKKLYPFLYKQVDSKIIPYELDKKHMTNPDSNNTYWIYYIHNKLWLPLLIYDKNSNSCLEQAYPVLFVNNNVVIDINRPSKLRSLLPNMSEDISLYHPNEILACQLASSIIYNRPIDTDLLNMLNNLC